MAPPSLACSFPSTSRTTPACSSAAWHALRAAWFGVPSRHFHYLPPQPSHLTTTIMPDTNHSTQSHTLYNTEPTNSSSRQEQPGVFELFNAFRLQLSCDLSDFASTFCQSRHPGWQYFFLTRFSVVFERTFLPSLFLFVENIPRLHTLIESRRESRFLLTFLLAFGNGNIDQVLEPWETAIGGFWENVYYYY